MDPMTCIEEERVAQFPLNGHFYSGRCYSGRLLYCLVPWYFPYSFSFRVPIFSTKMEVYVKIMYSATDDRFKIKILLHFTSALSTTVCILYVFHSKP